MTPRPDDRDAIPTNGHADALASFGFDSHDETWLEKLRSARQAGPLGFAGRYELLEEVGRGGQGIVHRARDRETGRVVAVKQLRDEAGATPERSRRFEREMEAAGMLDHASIVGIAGVDRDGDHAILAMEWIDGAPIAAWAADHPSGRRPVDEIVTMIVAVCDAVHYAHQRGVIHRDLKPSNILVDAADTPHLLDFGIAKLERPVGAALDLTQSGQYLGTPLYSSPEQIRDGVDGLDVRTDVYSLGLVLYEALTGRLPFAESRTLARVFEAVQNAEPLRPSSIRAVDRDLEAIVMKAIARDPDQRYASVDAMRRDLRCFEAGLPVEARRGGQIYFMRKLVRRHWLALTAAAGLMTVLAAIAVTATVQQKRVEREALRTREVVGFLGTMLTPGTATDGEASLVLDLTRRAEQRVRTELRDRPDVEAGVRSALAGVYAGFWRWEEASGHAEFVIAHYRRTGRRDSRELADALEIAGLAAAFKSDPRAIGLAERSLAIRRAEYGDDHRSVASAHATLALALWRTRRPDGFDAAEAHFVRADSIYSRIPDAGSRYAAVHYSWAAMLRVRGRPDLATVRYQAALDLFAQSDGGFAGPYLSCLDEFAGFLVQCGDATGAEAMMLDALTRIADDLPDAQLQRVHERLAGIQASRGDHDAAARSVGRALATRCDLLSHEVPDHGLALRIAARELRAKPPAEIDCRAILAVFTPIPAPYRRELDRLRAAIGLALRKAGRPDAAEAWIADPA